MSRTLIKNAMIVTMDAALGDLLPGDILIEDDRIAAIGRNLQAGGAEVVDGTHRIVAPGFINAHMHTWQAALKAVAANWTLLEYFKWIHAGLATQFRPDDIGIANAVRRADPDQRRHHHAGRLVPQQPDAGAHRRRHRRAVRFRASAPCSCTARRSPIPKPGQPHFSEVNHPRHEIERLLKGRFASSDQLVTLGLAILGPHYSTLEVARHDFKLGPGVRPDRLHASGRADAEDARRLGHAGEGRI